MTPHFSQSHLLQDYCPQKEELSIAGPPKVISQAGEAISVTFCRDRWNHWHRLLPVFHVMSDVKNLGYAKISGSEFMRIFRLTYLASSAAIKCH